MSSSSTTLLLTRLKINGLAYSLGNRILDNTPEREGGRCEGRRKQTVQGIWPHHRWFIGMSFVHRLGLDSL